MPVLQTMTHRRAQSGFSSQTFIKIWGKLRAFELEKLQPNAVYVVTSLKSAQSRTVSGTTLLIEANRGQFNIANYSIAKQFEEV